MVDIVADRIDHPGDFMAGHARIVEPGKAALLDESIGMTDAAGFDPDPNLIRPRLRNMPIDQFEIAARAVDLSHFHLRHDTQLLWFG